MDIVYSLITYIKGIEIITGKEGEWRKPAAHSTWTVEGNFGFNKTFYSSNNFMHIYAQTYYDRNKIKIRNTQIGAKKIMVKL